MRGNLSKATPTPRERLAQLGAAALRDDELVAILLGTGTRCRSVHALAQDVLREFGDLEGLLRQSGRALAQHTGIGPAKAARVSAALELARRLTRPALTPRLRMTTSGAVFDLFGASLALCAHEEMHVAVLDSRFSLVRYIELARGGLSVCALSPADIFRSTLREQGTFVVLLHNHPSGDPSPSQADIEFTRRACAAGEIVGVMVLDHIIVTPRAYYSFAESEWIPNEWPGDTRACDLRTSPARIGPEPQPVADKAS